MQDFDSPFNPLGQGGPTIDTGDGQQVVLPDGCCNGGCGCEPLPVANDSHAVVIKVPVGFTPYDLNAPGTPVMDGEQCIGQIPAGGYEQFEPLTLTVGELKELFLSTLSRGNYADTKAHLRRIRRELIDLRQPK